MRGAVAAALLALLVLVPVAHAQPRAPLPHWEDPDGPPVPMEVWLRRLVGQFSIEGVVQMANGDCPSACRGVYGKGDCVAVGEGPGVHCIFNVRWFDMAQVNFETGARATPPGSISYLNPAMALFGMQPGGPSLHFLLVDNKGLPEGGPGALNGSYARFITRCVNAVLGCQRKMTIEAREGSNLLYMTIEADNEFTRTPISTIVMSLRRMPPGRPPQRR